MYVCAHACMYVFARACMYACMHACMHVHRWRLVHICNYMHVLRTWVLAEELIKAFEMRTFRHLYCNVVRQSANVFGSLGFGV